MSEISGHVTLHYRDLGGAFDWSCRVGNLIKPNRSTTQFWVVTRHQYGIPALVSQTSFGGETSGEASPNVVCFLRLRLCMVAENCLSKNPHFEGSLFIFYYSFYLLLFSTFFLIYILIQKKNESKIK